jgi:hypothetical protein
VVLQYQSLVFGHSIESQFIAQDNRGRRGDRPVRHCRDRRRGGWWDHPRP